MNCLVRKIEVADQPEERVRQDLLQKMVGSLGFPLSLIAVEKGLSHISELPNVPDCRVDILVFTKEFEPLLIIECKAVPLLDGALQQVMGYNHYLGAPFFAVANDSHVEMGWWDREDQLKTVSFLPSYQQLLASK